MAIGVDLSASQLRPEAVLQFIDQHAAERPPQNILFKVSEPAFRLHRSRISNIVAVSPVEARRMNAELNVSGSPTDYLVSGAEWRCSKCRRYLNFFDIYESGKKHHDNEFFKIFLGGGDYHIQVAREASLLEVACTDCRTVNELKAPVHYSGTVGGSAYTYL
jgi:hypothetical protein